MNPWEKSLNHVKSAYSKTCFKRPHKFRQNKDLNDKLSLNAGRKYFRIHSAIILTFIRAFCSTFDLYQALIGHENKFLLFMWIIYVISVLFCYAFMHVCLLMPCDHLLGKS